MPRHRVGRGAGGTSCRVWPRALAETWTAAGVREAKADPCSPRARLARRALNSGLWRARLARRALTAYRMPIEGRDEWIAAVGAIGMRDGQRRRACRHSTRLGDDQLGVSPCRPPPSLRAARMHPADPRDAISPLADEREGRVGSRQAAESEVFQERPDEGTREHEHQTRSKRIHGHAEKLGGRGGLNLPQRPFGIALVGARCDRAEVGPRDPAEPGTLAIGHQRIGDLVGGAPERRVLDPMARDPAHRIIELGVRGPLQGDLTRHRHVDHRSHARKVLDVRMPTQDSGRFRSRVLANGARPRWRARSPMG